jgi:TRAP-type C4-dicarboxylate transport system permease small subunit
MPRALRGLVDHFEEYAAGLIMAVLLVVLGLQVATRIAGASLSWTEEAARYLFIWIIWLGASGAVRDRSHIGIAFLVNFLPARLRLAVALVVNALVLFFLANVVYWGWRAVVRQWDIPTAALELPTGLVYLVLPVSAALMVVRTIVQMHEDVRAGDPAAVPAAHSVSLD